MERWGAHLAGETLGQAGDLAMEMLEPRGAAPRTKFLDHESVTLFKASCIAPEMRPGVSGACSSTQVTAVEPDH